MLLLNKTSIHINLISMNSSIFRAALEWAAVLIFLKLLTEDVTFIRIA